MNIAHRLTENAKLFPEKIAVKVPHFNKKTKVYDYESLTFKELDIRSNKFATGLQKLACKKVTRHFCFFVLVLIFLL